MSSYGANPALTAVALIEAALNGEEAATHAALLTPDADYRAIAVCTARTAAALAIALEGDGVNRRTRDLLADLRLSIVVAAQQLDGDQR